MRLRRAISKVSRHYDGFCILFSWILFVSMCIEWMAKWALNTTATIVFRCVFCSFSVVEIIFMCATMVSVWSFLICVFWLLWVFFSALVMDNGILAAWTLLGCRYLHSPSPSFSLCQHGYLLDGAGIGVLFLTNSPKNRKARKALECSAERERCPLRYINYDKNKIALIPCSIRWQTPVSFAWAAAGHIHIICIFYNVQSVSSEGFLLWMNTMAALDTITYLITSPSILFWKWNFIYNFLSIVPEV